MKTLAIIGSNGMLGSDLVQLLNDKFIVTPITKKNYNFHKGHLFDIVVNANGNSKRFWANQNPEKDFIKSTVSVHKTLFDLPCKVYIYISSSDVYENHIGVKYTKERTRVNFRKLQTYGLNKHLSEIIVEKHTDKFLILRSSMILGTKLKKGPIYDIIHNYPLLITPETKLQLITTQAIADIIKILLEKSIINETINIGGTGTFAFTKIYKYFDRKIRISDKAEKQVYEMNITKLKNIYPNLKTSEEYLQEFLNFKR